MLISVKIRQRRLDWRYINIPKSITLYKIEQRQCAYQLDICVPKIRPVFPSLITLNRADKKYRVRINITYFCDAIDT